MATFKAMLLCCLVSVLPELQLVSMVTPPPRFSLSSVSDLPYFFLSLSSSSSTPLEFLVLLCGQVGWLPLNVEGQRHNMVIAVLAVTS